MSLKSRGARRAKEIEEPILYFVVDRGRKAHIDLRTAVPERIPSFTGWSWTLTSFESPNRNSEWARIVVGYCYRDDSFDGGPFLSLEMSLRGIIFRAQTRNCGLAVANCGVPDSGSRLIYRHPSGPGCRLWPTYAVYDLQVLILSCHPF